MKIQYLAVIFILIILPIIMVFSEYLGNQIDTIKTENLYNARLLDSTYDAIKAYQLNTVNNAKSDVITSKVSGRLLILFIILYLLILGILDINQMLCKNMFRPLFLQCTMDTIYIRLL